MEEELLPLVDKLSSYSGDEFYKFVKQYLGITECEIFEIQCIRSIRILLQVPDVFAFFQINSKDIISLKRQACIIADDNSYVVRAGIRSNIEQFIGALKALYGLKSTKSNFSYQTATSFEIRYL